MKYPYRISSYCNFSHGSSGIVLQQIRYWLYDNVGPAGDYWQFELYEDKIVAKFVHEKDAIMFALRWV